MDLKKCPLPKNLRCSLQQPFCNNVRFAPQIKTNVGDSSDAGGNSVHVLVPEADVLVCKNLPIWKVCREKIKALQIPEIEQAIQIYPNETAYMAMKKFSQ